MAVKLIETTFDKLTPSLCLFRAERDDAIALAGLQRDAEKRGWAWEGLVYVVRLSSSNCYYFPRPADVELSEEKETKCQK